MDRLIEILPYSTVVPGASLFIAAVTIFLHCFYDTNFLWSGKKTLWLCLYTLLDLVAVFCVWGTKAMDYLWMLETPIILVIVLYDYQGKKFRALWRYLWAMLIAYICITMVAMNATMVLFPELEQKFLEMDILQMGTEELLTLFTEIWYMVATVQLCFLIPVVWYLYFGVYKRGIVVQCGKRERWFVTIYTLLCLAFEIVIGFSGPKGDVTRYCLTGLSILAAMLFPIFIYYIRVSQHYQKLTEAQEQYMQSELEHFMEYKQAQEETARFRHDIRNNLLCIREMLQSGKAQEAQEYLNDLLTTTDGLRKKYITGDEILDCIIGMKSEIMAEKDIGFQLDGVLAGGLQWRVMDVCAVFANAFDNAIEACEKLPREERYIHLTIKATEQFWFLTMENPVKEKVNTKRLFQRIGGYTSKADTKQHGIGTYNMKRVVESHGGLVKATCQDQVFALEIVLDKRQALKAS